MTCPDCAALREQLADCANGHKTLLELRESRLRAERERDEARAGRDGWRGIADTRLAFANANADRLAAAQKRIEGLEEALHFARRLPMAKKNRDRILAALSSPAVTTGGLGEEVAAPILDALGDSDLVGLRAEMLGREGNDTGRETQRWARRVRAAIEKLQRRRAAPPKTSEGA